jgi:hypothetical protein
MVKNVFGSILKKESVNYMTTDLVKIEERKKLMGVVDSLCPALLIKDLFDSITERELDKVMVGEVEARKTIFLCALGSLVTNANTASYNLLVNDLAGAGKDYITAKTLELMPTFRFLKRTRISPTVFTYWHNSKFEPDWTWDGKVLYLEDVSNSVLNSPVFKVMCSSGSMATIVKDQRAIDIIIKGKPVIIVTSASANPTPELVRRFSIVNLDSGIKQTEAIVKRHLEYAVLGKSPSLDNMFQDALNNLHPVKVKIPYAEKIGQYIPNDNIIMRTHILRFLDYIKASCALYQYQREVDKDGYHIATEQDYQIARIALLKTTSNQYMIPLTKDQRRILDVFKELGSNYYTVGDLEPKVTWMSDKWLKEQLDRLVEYGLLIKENQINENTGRKNMVYAFIENKIAELPLNINIINCIVVGDRELKEHIEQKEAIKQKEQKEQ